jgi:hypothetical protein
MLINDGYAIYYFTDNCSDLMEHWYTDAYCEILSYEYSYPQNYGSACYSLGGDISSSLDITCQVGNFPMLAFDALVHRYVG